MCQTPVSSVDHTLCTYNKVNLSRDKKKLYSKVAKRTRCLFKNALRRFDFGEKHSKSNNFISFLIANKNNVLVLRRWPGRVPSKRRTLFSWKLKKKMLR